MPVSSPDGSGDDPVTENLTRGTEALIAGENHPSALVAPADELEEQVHPQAPDRILADRINDE